MYIYYDTLRPRGDPGVRFCDGGSAQRQTLECHFHIEGVDPPSIR